VNLARIKDRLRAVLARARERFGVIDHLVRAVEHY
jgi:hypothetical protein